MASVIYTFRVIKNWLHLNFNKYHWKTIKAATFSWPWDEYYYLEINKYRLLEMAHYFEKYGVAKDNKRCAEVLKLLAKLIDIFNGAKDNELYTYDERTGNYISFIKVNQLNAARFTEKKDELKFFIDMPHELYKRKAERLFGRIMQIYLHRFWD